MAGQGEAQFALVVGDRAALISESADLADFHVGEVFLELQDEKGAARAGTESFHLGLERLPGESVGGACSGDTTARGLKLPGGVGDADGDVLFEAGEISFGLAQAETGSA